MSERDFDNDDPLVQIDVALIGITNQLTYPTELDLMASDIRSIARATRTKFLQSTRIARLMRTELGPVFSDTRLCGDGRQLAIVRIESSGDPFETTKTLPAKIANRISVKIQQHLHKLGLTVVITERRMPISVLYEDESAPN